MAYKDDLTGEDLIQRDDDTPQAVKKRLQIFKETSDPLTHFYKEKGILTTFTGDKTADIWPMVDKFLKENM